jgi:hypothetical protein
MEERRLAEIHLRKRRLTNISFLSTMQDTSEQDPDTNHHLRERRLSSISLLSSPDNTKHLNSSNLLGHSPLECNKSRLTDVSLLSARPPMHLTEESIYDDSDISHSTPSLGGCGEPRFQESDLESNYQPSLLENVPPADLDSNEDNPDREEEDLEEIIPINTRRREYS